MSQIDQSNFEATEVQHVFRNKGTEDYFFCDETSEAHGPYTSIDQAKANLELYAKHNLNPVEEMSASIMKMLTGDGGDLAAMLREMTMLRRPRISGEERNLMIDQAMEAVMEEIEVGRTLLPQKGYTIETATIEMATRLVLSFHDNEAMPKMLAEKPLDLTTYEGAKETIRRFFLERMFTLAPGGDDNTYVSVLADQEKTPIEVAREMTKGFWKMALDHENGHEVELSPEQAHVNAKVSEGAAYVTTEMRRRGQGIELPKLLTTFAQNLQVQVILHKSDDQQLLKEFLATNAGGSIDDVQEAMHMIALLALEYMRKIPQEDLEKDIKEQRWEFNEPGEAKFLELAKDAADRTIFELT